MQKAHLDEAIHVANRGNDDAVRGLVRLKRGNDSELEPGYFDEKLALFEMHRALLDGFLCDNTQSSEPRDEARFAKLHREYETRALEDVQIYTDVQAVEAHRRLDAKTHKVRFLSDREQREWKRQYPKVPTGSELRARIRVGEGDRD